jgi:hypothetical protein
MGIIESIILNDLRPWLDKNQKADDYYPPALRNNPLVQESFTANYIIDFSIPPFSDKIRYYQRLVNNDITAFLNQLIEGAENDSENIVLFKLKKANSLLNSLLVSTNNLIIRRGYDLTLITSKHADFNTDREHKESTFITNYTLVSLIKCFLEVQSHFSEYIHPDNKMNIADIYGRILNKPVPENTYLKEVQVISSLPLLQKANNTKSDILSFKYKKIQAHSSNITDLMDSLKKNKFIAQETSITDFRHLFSGEFVANPIRWTGGKSTLSYFIKLLNNQLEVITYSGNSVWKIVCACFVDDDGSQFDEPNLRDQKIPKLKQQEVERAANLLK